MIRTVLTIAGSDPSGGAGIQADLKTMTALGVYGAAVITCITVQNSRGVARVEPLDPGLVEEQIAAVLADHRVTHIKIGMVGTAAVARAIRDALVGFRGEVVYDPVLTATTGQELMKGNDLSEVYAILPGITTVLTPNIPELSRMTDMRVATGQDLETAVRTLFDRHASLRCILVKGGHAGHDDRITDHLFHAAAGPLEMESITHPFVATANAHGTGCTLSSAFAACHSLSGDYSTAFRRSVEFLQTVLEKSRSVQIVKNPEGSGGLLHHLAFSRIL